MQQLHADKLVCACSPGVLFTPSTVATLALALSFSVLTYAPNLQPSDVTVTGLFYVPLNLTTGASVSTAVVRAWDGVRWQPLQ